MTRRRPGLAALAALAGLLPLAGCGIQGTDVVEAGAAATVLVAPNPGSRMVLYFVGPDGRSMPVARDVGFGSPDSTGEADLSGNARGHADGSGTGADQKIPGAHMPGTKVLSALLAGPSGAEAAAGLTTALPRGVGAPQVQVERPAGSQAGRLLRLRAPFKVTDLPPAAVRQLVCTAGYADDPEGRTEVAVAGLDGFLAPATCAETLGAAGASGASGE
ncbi:hypothetical protein [Streptomyces sp. NPDC056169]|uniref:hypothetical protein n=1 Tax=Streptomyces sp. NPDC056169 TaxID=3345734 RepID=UPI0035D8D720